jgi:hypothetical protein
MKRYLALLLLLTGRAYAEIPADLPPPPRLPPAIENQPVDEPEIRIVEKADAVHAEYRVRGKLYMIRVSPKVGKPYYLIDEDGRGSFIRHDEIAGPRISVPQWVLFKW